MYIYSMMSYCIKNKRVDIQHTGIRKMSYGALTIVLLFSKIDLPSFVSCFPKLLQGLFNAKWFHQYRHLFY